jgi:gliding motility-associated-like protein
MKKSSKNDPDSYREIRKIRKEIPFRLFFANCRLPIAYWPFVIAYCLLPTANCLSQGTWVQRANFGGGDRAAAAGFSIGTKGYIGTGMNTSTVKKKDFWEWDRTTNVWTQKADFGGIERGFAIGFSIGMKGYIGTGFDKNWNYCKDFWEWDQATNTWTKKANFSGAPRGLAIAFSIADKGYIGSGWNGSVNFDDFWEWDQATNTWTQKANIPGPKRDNPVAFSIANKGYVGTGNDEIPPYKFFEDFWEWDQATNIWSQKANFPGGKRTNAFGYSIGNYGYVGMGNDSNFINKINDLWRFFPFTNTWKQMASFPGGTRGLPIGFSIGCQGFFGTGWDTLQAPHDDYWEYYPDTITAAVAGAQSICSGDTALLYAFGGIQFLWSTGDTTQFIEVSPSVTTTYTVMVSDVCGSATTTANVTVYQLPIAYASFQPDLCGGNFIQFTDSSANTTSWNWSFGDGDTSTTQNPIHTYSTTGVYSVTLIVTNGNSIYGCTDNKQMIVDVPPFSELFIPNAFSPNGDNIDDVYYVFGKCITEMSFMIYDRWGEKIFETTNPAIGWDGKFKGQLENAGVFMYSFDGTLTTGEKITKKGNITLMR